jgi:RNA polymerase sigma-70 factor (ECF subfamily)
LKTLDPRIARAAAGDQTAFRSLFDEHVRRVHALSLRLMGDTADAEELTQDVFVAAWRQLEKYRYEGSFITWLHGIAVRMSRQRWRGLLRRRARHELLAGCEYTAAVEVMMPTADVELERALASLPQRMRTALVLHAIEGYSQAETAALMRVSTGAVKAHVHQARKQLKERMERS